MVYAGWIREIEAIVRKDVPTRAIYLDILKAFGRKNGLEIYRKLKECILQGSPGKNEGETEK